MRSIIVGAVITLVGCAQPLRPQHGGRIDNTNGSPDMMPGTISPDSCGGQEFTLGKTPPNIMLVLDRSLSMNDPIATDSTTTKWTDLQSAIGGLVSRYDATVRLGTTFFAADDDCAPGSVGELAADNGKNVEAALAAHTPGGNTPTATTLDAVIASHALTDDGRANYVVLATDGMPNCNDVDVTKRIRELYAASPQVRTFVIGLGSETNTEPDLLNAWADAGHTARSGAVHYYQSNSSSDLDAAFDQIAGDIASCDFTLTGAPDDPQFINVTENGTAVSPSPTVGWTYDGATHTVTLHGTACDVVKNDPQTKVSVVYGCPQLPPIP